MLIWWTTAHQYCLHLVTPRSGAGLGNMGFYDDVIQIYFGREKQTPL